MGSSGACGLLSPHISLYMKVTLELRWRLFSLTFIVVIFS